MTSNARIVTDTDIRQVIHDQGFADCSIVRQYIKPRPECLNEDGAWYLLFIVYRDGMAPVCWGRRRTMAELLDMAKRGPLC